LPFVSDLRDKKKTVPGYETEEEQSKPGLHWSATVPSIG
jgi:hypothetical protein